MKQKKLVNFRRLRDRFFCENKGVFDFLKSISIVLLMLSLALSAYLSWVSYSTGDLIACSGAASCSDVLTSKWSKVLGLPIALLGGLLYGFLLINVGRVQRESTSLMASLARVVMWLIPMAALWFVFVQAVILKAFCPFCCLTHLLATLAVVCLSILRRKSKNESVSSLDKKISRFIPLTATAALAGLISVQSLSESPEGIEIAEIAQISLSQESSQMKGEGPRILTLHDGEFQFDLKDVPLIGGSSAAHAIVLISDYSCGHCRKLHSTLRALQEDHGDEMLAIVQIPGFKNQKSLEVVKMILPLWKADQDIYNSIDRALYEGTLPASKEKVSAEIYQQMGGKAAYLTAIAPHEIWAKNLIGKSAKLFHRNAKETGRKVIPQLMVGDEIIVGFSKSNDRYHKLVEKHFDLPLLAVQEPAVVQHKNEASTQKSVSSATQPSKVRNAPVVTKDYSSNQPASKEISFYRDKMKFHFHQRKITMDFGAIPLFGSPSNPTVAVLVLDFLSSESREEARRLIQHQSLHSEQFSLALIAAQPSGNAKMIHEKLATLWYTHPQKYQELVSDIVSEEVALSVENLSKKIAPYLTGDVSSTRNVSTYLDISQQLFLANRKLAHFAPAPHLMLGSQLYYGDLSDVPLMVAQNSEPHSTQFLVKTSRVDEQK